MLQPRFLIVGPPDAPTYQTDDMAAATDTARLKSRELGVEFAVYTVLEVFPPPSGDDKPGDRL